MILLCHLKNSGPEVLVRCSVFGSKDIKIISEHCTLLNGDGGDIPHGSVSGFGFVRGEDFNVFNVIYFAVHCLTQLKITPLLTALELTTDFLSSLFSDCFGSQSDPCVPILPSNLRRQPR